jgi:AcrR family transcriptional regulator
MTSPDATAQLLTHRPKRADARRNYEKLIAAGLEAFTEEGKAASLEDIARRAGVGIGTLYRHFPSRQELLEAVYVEEVDALCRSAIDLAGEPPWEALVAWLHRFVGYLATKQALAEELLAYNDRDADVFQACRTAMYAGGEPLLVRAQEAHVVRTDTDIAEVIQLVGGIAKIQTAEPEQLNRLLDMALDGLRYQGSSANE